MVFPNCSSNYQKTTNQKALKQIDTAIEAVKKIESFYLVPCKEPIQPENDSLPEVMRVFAIVMEGASDCHNRHNALVKQL